jgi:hypothetical protein
VAPFWPPPSTFVGAVGSGLELVEEEELDDVLLPLREGEDPDTCTEPDPDEAPLGVV